MLVPVSVSFSNLLYRLWGLAGRRNSYCLHPTGI
uniref:Uncharacterized protein n=1 Tax=Rhizophora mucronata TaxID=61149 RepID=A0A2P2PGX9_RHIMU